jgi:putative FmdB family regulatory protein
VPIYEYVCRKCRKTFEYMQRMSDSPKRKCEACGAQALERLISQTSFHLKGSGWYKDLYSSPKPAGDAKPSGEAKSGGSEGGSSPAAGASSDSGSSAGASSDSGSGSGSGSGGTSETTKPGKKTKKGSR